MVGVGDRMHLFPLRLIYFRKHFLPELDPLLSFEGYQVVGCLAVNFGFVFKQSCKLFADIVRTINAKNTQIEETLELALGFQTLQVRLSQKVNLDVQVSESSKQLPLTLLLCAFAFITLLY